MDRKASRQSTKAKLRCATVGDIERIGDKIEAISAKGVANKAEITFTMSAGSRR